MKTPKKHWWCNAEGDVKNQSLGAPDMDTNTICVMLKDRIGLLECKTNIFKRRKSRPENSNDCYKYVLRRRVLHRQE